ncbi:hypothetical protein [Gilvimarinus algae]|uniref:Solute-binding protein family 3/N-terminal domain-containing protein n=1 Tax=Gilvimarinus algae TaxID=3058037 RepID=A0ABT8TGJ4_9GAMM|nr:hypothetical protein [Gilvimarinus sp. SDUM040014]MDO3383207.1 hypothetical protein [Gilvimarinus sp. SDUM040014]
MITHSLRQRFAHALLSCTLPVLSQVGLAAGDTLPAAIDRVVLSMGSMTQSRVEHETAITRLALEKSRDRYGDYSLDVHTTIYSRSRALRSLFVGETINAVSAPKMSFQVESTQQPLIVIPVPLLKGTLGQRLAIVRRDRLAEFNQIRTLEQLQQKSAGIGFDWIDKHFFEHNGLAYTTGADTTQLFNMLLHQRFDYLPLGMLEAESALEHSGMADQLAIVDNLIIDYPLPVYLQVSVNRPELAERLAYGLKNAQEDGSLDALFETHYGALMEKFSDYRRISLAPLPES